MSAAGEGTRRPLADRTVVITRAAHQCPELARLLSDRGSRVVHAPAIALADPDDWAPADRALRQLGSYDVIIFTSANAVDRFALRARSIDAALTGVRARIVAIGHATAEALARQGMSHVDTAAESRSEGVVHLLEAEPLAGRRILIPRAAVARELLVEALRERGAIVDVVPVYRTVGAPLTDQARRMLARGDVDVVVFASGGAVRHFLAEIGGRAGLGGAAMAVIGPVTRQAAVELGLTPAIVSTAAGMAELVSAIEDYFSRASAPRSDPGETSRGSAPR